MTAAKDHGYHFQIAGFAMDKQQTQYQLIPKWKWKTLTNYWKFQKSECPRHWGFVYHDTNGQKPWSSMEDPVVPLERNLYGHPLAGLLWERQFEKSPYWNMDGRKFQIGNVSSFIVKKGLFLSVHVGDIKIGWKENTTLIRCWKY